MQNVLHVRATNKQTVDSPTEAPSRGEGPERQLVAPKQVVSVAKVYKYKGPDSNFPSNVRSGM